MNVYSPFLQLLFEGVIAVALITCDQTFVVGTDNLWYLLHKNKASNEKRWPWLVKLLAPAMQSAAAFKRVQKSARLHTDTKHGCWNVYLSLLETTLRMIVAMETGRQITLQAEISRTLLFPLRLALRELWHNSDCFWNCIESLRGFQL